MGLLKRAKNLAPRAARSMGKARGAVSSLRTRKTKKTGLLSRVRTAASKLDDQYLGGATDALVGGKLRGRSVAAAGMGRRSKRMNPMNAKAARRAARRVRSSISMLERLKKSLPHVSAKGKVTKTKRARR